MWEVLSEEDQASVHASSCICSTVYYTHSVSVFIVS